ncbi:MAG: hypothetical protein AAFU85_13535 [Planctomycetota bacterium]
MLARLGITFVVVSVLTTITVFRALRSDDFDRYGHQGGNHAVMFGSILAGLIYTPILAFSVWGVPWWVCVLLIPTAFVTAPLGLLACLPLLNVVDRVWPHEDDEDTAT